MVSLVKIIQQCTKYFDTLHNAFSINAAGLDNIKTRLSLYAFDESIGLGHIGCLFTCEDEIQRIAECIIHHTNFCCKAAFGLPMSLTLTDHPQGFSAALLPRRYAHVLWYHQL
jgi:hypothetical protein